MTRNELKDLIKDIIREECLIETNNNINYCNRLIEW